MRPNYLYPLRFDSGPSTIPDDDRGEHPYQGATMATSKTNTPVQTTIPNLPTAWDAEGVVQLDGFDIVDKKDLIGKPFLITGLEFKPGANGVEYVYVDALDAAGAPFQFNDSSSGVRAQLVRFVGDIGKADAVTSGELVSVRVAILGGLRVSEFEVKDERGRDKLAKTYYLTLSGKRPTA